MKRLFLPAALLLFGFAPMQLAAQTEDSLGLPGDNLDLSGVLELFKNASSMEDFEKAINTETNQVNNMDLDEDGNVDYIKVVDHSDSGTHAISLQIDIDEKESQDVAVIEIEKTGDETADLQIVGDEELYGKDYIVEPAEEETKKTEDKFTSDFSAHPIVIVNVWGWPCVRYVYAPAYVVWVSPWHYRHHPPYWRPWRPVAWRVHHGRVVRYHHHCRVVHVHRVHRAHRAYHRHRVHSPGYHQRNAGHRNGHGDGQRNGGGRKGNPGGKKGGNHRGGRR
ncbi:MAG TPA: hypothetical protein VK826_14095 [Bacteroidia bacterium]|nr:hypothetical protein [Bacteroidia bacterium]